LDASRAGACHAPAAFDDREPRIARRQPVIDRAGHYRNADALTPDRVGLRRPARSSALHYRGCHDRITTMTDMTAAAGSSSGTIAFDNPFRHGFIRTAVVVPSVRVADPTFNGEQTILAYHQAAAEGAALVAFPELGLSAYSCDDLFHQAALLAACATALARVIDASRAADAVAVVGLPLRVDNRLFNCAAVVARGRLLGIVPKTYLPNYGEFYEARQFASGESALATEVDLFGARVPFGSRLLFRCASVDHWTFHVEICEDVWVPIPPSSFAALAGATVLVNLSASNITIGKDGYRHQLASQQSARCVAAYLYTSAGYGESTTDLAWDGHALIYENGTLLAESERFATRAQTIFADVDVERLSRDRMRQTTFGQSVRHFRDQLTGWRTVVFDAPVPAAARGLRRAIERFPYVPSNAADRDQRCREVFAIQVQSLARRIEASGAERLVIGVSGGLDSALALLVCAQVMDRLGRPRDRILGCSMPGFATSGRTREQAQRLMASVGCESREIDIRPGCRQMLADIGHPFARGQSVYDVTFENVQAGERTSLLFRLANQVNGLVVGTGDLSELALGWCTYGVGDHMSHYSVNASVPKTLVSHLIRWTAHAGLLDRSGSAALVAILRTEISPELVPMEEGSDGADGAGDAAGAARAQSSAARGIDDITRPARGQSSEAAVGPYELQDFHLFHVLRYGFRPSKIAFLAHAAWSDPNRGRWPAGFDGAHNAYRLPEIKVHLRNFLYRFFKTSQFKRSCIPNAAKVGSGGSLSPRGDWRAPSDSEATVWLAELDAVPDEDIGVVTDNAATDNAATDNAATDNAATDNATRG
jgi:NAD+ synthase (glutamine-hydrolysing)